MEFDQPGDIDVRITSAIHHKSDGMVLIVEETADGCCNAGPLSE